MRAADLHRLARALREIALRATENTGADRVNAGELAVLEDIARHPRSSIREITERSGLSQSLVSRITHALAAAGALTIEPDPADKRKVRIELTAGTRAAILQRAGNSIRTAIADSTPGLTVQERRALVHHLAEAAALLNRSAGH